MLFLGDVLAELVDLGVEFLADVLDDAEGTLGDLQLHLRGTCPLDSGGIARGDQYEFVVVLALRLEDVLTEVDQGASRLFEQRSVLNWLTLLRIASGAFLLRYSDFFIVAPCTR